ncbi:MULTISPECIES: US12 family protein [Bacillaceae]|uniref:US12 family protein n=1 Tax=Bacillaceae TaxID=186817 RepID=UPI0001E891F1|nr:US12 family protein [Bacillus sp. m3-13]
MGNLWRNSIHLLLELNILYFFILLLYLDSGNLPSFAGILLPYGFAIAIFGFLGNKLPSSYVAIMLVAPILALFAYLSSYSIGLSLIIGAIISFRAFMYFVEERFISTFALLIMSFIWMPFVYGAGTLVNYPHGLTLMILFGAQLALVILLYSGNAVFQLNGNRYMQKRVVGATAAVFIGIAAVSAVFATIGKYLITAGLSVFGLGVSFIFDILARPLFYLLGLHDWTIKSGGPQDEGGIEMGEKEEAETAELLPSEGLFDSPVVVAVGIIVFLSVLYLLLNKKKVNNQKREVQTEQQFSSTMTKKSGGGFFAGRRKQKPPEDEVRKLMFDLEQLALKKNRGRLPNETLEEWLKRETSFNENFMELYAKVRYGEMKLSPSEVETCRTMAEEIRKVMKQWKKAS